MIHVALVHRDLHEVSRGGICTLYRSLARHLANLGASVTMITQESPHPLQGRDVTVVSLPRTEDLVQHREAVADALDAVRPDVVDCSTWEAETLRYLAKPREDRAPVLVRGEFSAVRLDAGGLARDEHQLVQAADQVIAVSQYAAQDLTTEYGIPLPLAVANGVDRERFHPGRPTTPASGFHIDLGADGHVAGRRPIPDLLAAGETVSPWSPDPAGRLRLVWVGKITPMKGWDVLETATTRLRDIASVSVLLGHSPTFAPVTSASSELTVLQDLDDTDLPGLYRAADWLLSTSRWEGFGLAIAEALACGTPVLLPEHLGTAPELLAASGGYTYRDLDHLVDILTHAERLTGRLPDHFNWAVNAAESLRLYRALLGR
ncbi:glycosyltransferase family 4 protein [Verrucosispora sp. TAA-831]|uniref:glycosyltransferase family 4 protein n=1 Tax=Verrucosispora sp. TAA-831 TaxID=3422227 RepID=UPI003D6DB45A